MSAPQKQGRPPLLSHASVLREALSLVDDRGVEALTMRRLGARLGVDPMSVYSYFPSKASLFDGIVEQLFSEVRVPPATGSWEDDISAIARAARTSMLRHAGALVLLATRPPTTPKAFELLDACAVVLLQAGFSEIDAADGVDCLGRLLIGHLLAEGGVSPGSEPNDQVDARHAEAQAGLEPDRFPGLAAIGRRSIEHDPERLFEKGLRGLVVGLADAPRSESD